jgi:hypothetical protein
MSDDTHREGGVAFRPGQQHPDGWRDELNPEQASRTAYDVKDAHRLLSDITDVGLKEIPILPVGARLEQGATYMDLHDRQEFTATGDMSAGDENWYVPKDGVDYELWNQLKRTK